MKHGQTDGHVHAFLPCAFLFFLHQVAGSTSKADFACGVIRGLGGNLSLADRNSFAKEVMSEPNFSKRVFLETKIPS